MPSRAAGALLAVLCTALLAGCGSSSPSAGGADPASAVPATAALYAGAVVRPTGTLKTAAQSVGRALTHQPDPYLRLVWLLRTPGSPALEFARDLAPWLGERAGIFVTSPGAQGTLGLASLIGQALLARSPSTSAYPFGAGGAQGAIVLDTSDESSAKSFLDKQAARAGARSSSYRGLPLQANSGGVAFALVKHLAVIGSEAGVKGVIDTVSGGSALARSAGYATLSAAAPSDALAHVYSNPRYSPRSRTPGLTELLAGARVLNLSVVPSAGAVAIDADMLPAGAGSPVGLLGSGVGGAQPFAELPGDSWLALGVGDTAATLGEDVAGLRALAQLTGAARESANSSALSVGGLLEGILKPLGVMGAPTPQARRAFGSWMGAGAIFASGASVLELKAAAVIDSKAPALSRAAVPALAAALRSLGDPVSPVHIAGTEAAVSARINGLPLMLDIAAGRSSGGQAKFVLGLGEASVQAALAPSSVLSGSAALGGDARALGEGAAPNLLINVPTILSLLEGVGLTEDPAVSTLLPLLRSATTVAGGVHGLGGGVERVRIVAGIRQGEG